MKVIFIGTSEFAVGVLKKIHGLCDIPFVISQPDRPKGRGRKLLPTPVKEAAMELGLEVVQPERIKEAFGLIKEANPDIILVVSYGQIIPKNILDIPRIGPLNIHPSLLPKYRGAAPIQRAIMNGEEKTGVTIMWMNEKLDAGDIFIQREVRIDPDEDAGSLHDRLMLLASDMMVEALELIKTGNIVRIPQNDDMATYAPAIGKEETKINWSNDAVDIHNLVRALSPKPAAYTYMGDIRCKIYKTKLSDGTGTPGSIILKDSKKGILRVACGNGSLDIIEIQPEGKKRMHISDFLKGYGNKI